MSHKQTRTEKWALLSVVGSTMKENSNIIEGNLEKTRMVSGVDSLLSGGGTTPPPTATGSNHGLNAAAVPRAGGIILSAVPHEGGIIESAVPCVGGIAGSNRGFIPPLLSEKRNKHNRVQRKCSYPTCDNRVQQGGVCVTHGARRKGCSHPGCNKAVKLAGNCSTHGPS